MPPRSRHGKAMARRERPKAEPAVYQFPPLHTFGFSGIRGRLAQIGCVDSQTVLFVIGCGLYKYSNFCSVQVVPTEASVEKLSAVVVSATGRHVALCEKHRGAPSLVSVYNMRGPALVRKFLTKHNLGIDVCGFSKDEKQVVASLSSGTGALLYCWDVELPRERFIEEYPHAVTRISVSLEDNDVFALNGPSTFKVWSRKPDGETYDAVEGLEEPEGTKCTFTDHVWLLDNSVALATANDVIFIVKDGVVKHKFLESGHTICLAATPLGFYAGRKDGVITQIGGWDVVTSEYEVRSRTPYENVTCKAVASESAPITTLVVAPNDLDVVYVVEGENVGRLELKPEEQAPGASTISVDLSMPVFTMGPITDMDICPHRMLIATCGEDKVVRIWSYARLVCETTCPFEEEVLAVAINQCNLLVAFGIVIKIYFLMAEKVVQIHEIMMKGVRQMRWSPSGHVVAIAAGRDVVLLSTFNWKIMTLLKGHMGAVSSVAWSPDSIYLSSAGIDGAVHSWFMDGFHRYAECVTTGSCYSAILYDANRKYIYACGANIPLRAVETDKKVAVPQLVPAKDPDVGSPVEPDTEYDEASASCWEHHIFRAYTACEMNRKGVTRIAGLFGWGLLAATNETGELLFYSVPLGRETKGPVWEEHINAGKITGLFVDEKHDLILMASSQGSIILLTVRKLPVTPDPPDPPSPRGFLPVVDNSLVNILPVYWTDLQEAKRAAHEFTRQMQKEHAEMLYKDHIKEQDWAIVVKEKNELHAKIESEYALRLRLLEQRILMAESEKETSIQSLLDAQEINLKDMNEFYERKIIEEAKQAHLLRLQEQKERVKVEGIMIDRQRAYSQKLVELQRELEGAQAQADKKVMEVESICNTEVKKCKQSFDMELMVNDEELEHAIKRLTKELVAERRKAENEYAQLSYEKNLSVQYQAQIAQIAEGEATYDESLQEFLQENLRLKKLVVEVDTERMRAKRLLLETDERSESLLQHNKDQETQHMISDYNIQQLLRRKDPMEAEIRRMRKYLHDMECQQAGHLLDLRHTKIVERDLRDKLAVNEGQLKQLHDKVAERDIVINTFITKLGRVIDENADSQWPALTKELYDTYVRDMHRVMNKECMPAKGEIRHQRQVLQKFVKVLEMAITRIDKEHALASQRLVQENLRLLHGFSDSNRNAQRLALIVKELQGEEAYFKAVAAKHRYVTLSVLTRMSETRESKIKKENMMNQARSKSRGPMARGRELRSSTRSQSLSPEPKFQADLRKAREAAARASQAPGSDPNKKKRLSVRGKRVARPQTSMDRYSSLSSPDNPLALLDVESELRKKNEEIEQLQKNLHRLSLKPGMSPPPGPGATGLRQVPGS